MVDIEPIEVLAQQHVVNLGTGLYGIEQLTGFRRRVQECFLFSTLSCTSVSLLKF
jgi:hypothetical protein